MSDIQDRNFLEYITLGKEFISNNSDNGTFSVQDIPSIGILDMEFLDEFLGLVGSDVINNGIELFEHSGNEYINNVKTGIESKDLKLASSEAHKLKGAANSIGLKQVGFCAKEIQLMINAYLEEVKVDDISNVGDKDSYLIEFKGKVNNEIQILEELIDISLQILKIYISK